MTTLLRRIAASPAAADLRAGRWDTALMAVAIVLAAVLVTVFLGDQYFTAAGYQPIPTEVSP